MYIGHIRKNPHANTSSRSKVCHRHVLHAITLLTTRALQMVGGVSRLLGPCGGIEYTNYTRTAATCRTASVPRLDLAKSFCLWKGVDGVEEKRQWRGRRHCTPDVTGARKAEGKKNLTGDQQPQLSSGDNEGGGLRVKMIPNRCK